MALIQAKQLATSARANFPSRSNKNMAASTTAADHDLACATAIASNNVVDSAGNGGYVGVRVNGVAYEVGDGDRTHDCYFSGDGGVTARAFSAIVAGDLLYWNGSIVGFQLAAATDKIDFVYNALTA